MKQGRTPCPPAGLLAAYSERPDEHPEVARHASACSDCAEVLKILSRLRDDDVSSGIDAYLGELDALMEELRAVPRHRWPSLLTEPRFQRIDLSRRLITAGLDQRWKEPRLAVDLTKAAAQVADAVTSEEPEVAEMRFDAWKYHSALLRESGRYDECRHALARAAEAAMHVTDVELADASILFSRALLASEPDIWQPDEAATLLDLVEAIFGRRDRERWLRARTARGTLLYRMGDPRCIDVYREVLHETPEHDAPAWHDALAHVLMARVEHGDDGADIDQQFATVEREHTRRGALALIARDHWLRGRLLALRQQHTPAEQAFAGATAVYLEMNNQDAAVRVGIDWIASMIALEEYGPAIDLCRSLAERSVRLDQQEPTRRRALTAEVTAYLRELAQRYALTEDIVLDVRRYIFRITYQRPFPFLPPLPLLTV